MESLLIQLVYFGFFQSILILSVYLFSPRKRRNISGYLAFLILILFIGLSGKVLHGVGFWGGNFRLIALSEMSALLFGPTVFLFVRSILHNRSYADNDLVHYVPGYFYSLFIFVYFISPSDAVLAERSITGETMRAIYACHAIGLVVNITYWFISWRMYKDFNNRIKEEVSYELHTRFIVNFLLVIGFCLLVWTVLYVTSFFGYDMLERNARPYIWILLTLIILFITYYGMLSPQALRIVPEEVKQKYNQSKFSDDEMDDMKLRLDNLMRERKPYLNKKLLKSELAEMFGINDPELSRLLNERIGMNFFEYVNYYRIKEFVELAKTPRGKQLTLYGIAQEAGFNSKTTFYKSFKKLMGTSPSDYFNKNNDL